LNRGPVDYSRHTIVLVGLWLGVSGYSHLLVGSLQKSLQRGTVHQEILLDSRIVKGRLLFKTRQGDGDVISSPDELGRIRLQAMREFLDDYEPGRKYGRYILTELPDLPLQINAGCVQSAELFEGLLLSGGSALPDPKRKGFYDLQNDGRTFFI